MLKTTLRLTSLILLVGALVAISPRGVYAFDDTDGDGISNPLDNCPTTANPDQKDSNHDGIGDACGGQDNDGIIDALDNCPTVYNPDQKNSYGGPAGDACEAESGTRLNGSANNVIVYLITDTQELQFYTPTGQQLGGVDEAAVLALANQGVGASLKVTADGKVTVSYLGNSVFQVTNNLTATNASSTFKLDGVTGVGATSPATSAPSTSAHVPTYTVRAGDTLTKIAKLFNTTVAALVKANNLKDANVLRIGQVLTIP